jgi:hypothetical protein
MGLDMYLNGRKILLSDYKNPENDPTEDHGYPIKEKILRLGYWRKHPNLHGFIIKNYANGKDECQEIELNHEKLTEILKAVEQDNLPYTSGFFFGVSHADDKLPTIDIFKKAIEWEQVEERQVIRIVYYRASW